MPITVVTGQPGNGKTLYMMEMLEKAYLEAKRPIYCSGVQGKLPGLVRPLTDPRDWESVEDGSLVFIDEAWKAFGHLQDARGAPTPQYVQALATHRHRGIDFVMTTQMVNQLYPFMRGLVGEHVHISRKFGTSLCTVYKWGEICEDVKSQTQRDKALSSQWLQPSRLFSEYETGSGIHTIKPKIPWRVMLIPVSVIAAGLFIWLAYVALHRYGPDRTADIKAAQAHGAGGAEAATDDPGDGKRKKPLTDAEWIQRLTPRWEGVHGSQPVFDDRKVTAIPRTYCVMSVGKHGEDTCHCYTEQVTPVEGRLFDSCKSEALHGQYDPFREPERGGAAPAQYVAAPLQGEPGHASVVIQGNPLQVASPGMGVIRGKGG